MTLRKLSLTESLKIHFTYITLFNIIKNERDIRDEIRWMNYFSYAWLWYWSSKSYYNYDAILRTLLWS